MSNMRCHCLNATTENKTPVTARFKK